MGTYTREEFDFRALAKRQHGIVHRKQLLEGGFSKDKITRLTKRGDISLVHPQVFVVAGAPDTWEQRVYAASASLGDGWAVALRTAARIWKFDSCESDLIEFIGAGRIPSKRKRVVLHETDYLPRGHITRHGGFRITTASRTLLDLGAVTSIELVEDALESAIRMGLTTPEYLQRQLDEFRRPGRRGAAAIAHVLSHRLPGPPTESQFETSLLRTLRRFGVPMPVKQERFFDEDGFVARTDFFYPHQRLVVEAHSRKHHGPNREGHDSKRRNRLAALGYRTIEVTYRRLRDDPEGVAREISRALLS